MLTNWVRADGDCFAARSVPLDAYAYCVYYVVYYRVAARASAMDLRFPRTMLLTLTDIGRARSVVDEITRRLTHSRFFYPACAGGCWARAVSWGYVKGNLTRHMAWNLIQSYPSTGNGVV